MELDDAYFGAPKSNGKQGRGTEKISALATVSLSEQGHPRFFKIQVSNLDAPAVSAVAQRTVPPGSEIRSDALGSFRAALREGYAHHYHLCQGKRRFALGTHPDLQFKGFSPRNLPWPGQKASARLL